MATVKGLYDLIKNEESEGKKLSPFEQAIVDPYEADEPKTTKEVHVTFVKNKDQIDK